MSGRSNTKLALLYTRRYDSPMDIKDMLNEILSCGYTQEQVARIIGVSQVAICKISTGRTKSVMYSTGLGIRDLHKRVMRKQKQVQA